jgi:hypothetical protein
MDTNINLNIMIPKEIRKIIKEVISEVNNAVVATKTGTKTISYKNPGELDSLKKDPNVSSIETTGGQRIKEMARKPKGYQIIDPDFDTTPYVNKKISGTSLSDIIAYIKENPGTEKKDIQNNFNFVRPQIANAVVNGLKDAGIIAKVGEISIDDETGEITVTDEEPTYKTRPDAEDFFVGSRKGPFFSDYETTSNEPQIDDEPNINIPKDLPSNISTKGMSDEDYNAFMEYMKYKERLAKIKSALIQAKKGRKFGDDLSNTSNEIQKLTDKKLEYENRIANIAASNEYIKNRIQREKENLSENLLRNRMKELANLI